MKYREALQAAGKECLKKALDEAGGNVRKAAGLVGLKRQSMYLALERHGLHVRQPKRTVLITERRWLR